MDLHPKNIVINIYIYIQYIIYIILSYIIYSLGGGPCKYVYIYIYKPGHNVIPRRSIRQRLHQFPSSFARFSCVGGSAHYCIVIDGIHTVHRMRKFACRASSTMEGLEAPENKAQHGSCIPGRPTLQTTD